MAKYRKVKPNAEQHRRWKSHLMRQCSKTAKPYLESSILSNINPTYPQQNWLFRHKLLFRSMHDLASPKTEWSPEYLSKKIRDDSPPNTIFFADTGFFSVPMEFLVWDAILSRKLAITPLVWDELQPWLNNPHHNRLVSDLIRSAQHTRINSIDFINQAEFCNFSYSYYLALLSVRKYAWKKVLKDFVSNQGRSPTEAEMKKALQEACGDGAFIAQKGWKDRLKPTLLADEELVVFAVLTSILRGVEVVILTLDNDIQRRFIDLTNLIAGHYHSMWAGEHFWRFRDEYPGLYPPTIDVPEKEAGKLYEAGKVSGMFFPADCGIDFLPPNPIPALMHCIFFDQSTTHRKYSVASFYGETGVRQLLEFKQQSNGMNTKRFEGYNCYLTVAPPKGKPMLGFGIGRDAHVQVNGVQVTALDSLHANLKRSAATHLFYQVQKT